MKQSSLLVKKEFYILNCTALEIKGVRGKGEVMLCAEYSVIVCSSVVLPSYLNFLVLTIVRDRGAGLTVSHWFRNMGIFILWAKPLWQGCRGRANWLHKPEFHFLMLLTQAFQKLKCQCKILVSGNFFCNSQILRWTLYPSAREMGGRGCLRLQKYLKIQ